jgi:hypothetical protein
MTYCFHWGEVAACRRGTCLTASVPFPKSVAPSGAGPAFLFPTATDDAFGREQWGVGPALVVGYQTKEAIFGAFASTISGSDRAATMSQASRTRAI